MRPKNLRDVVKYDLCAGCGICAALDQRGATQMELDTRGYLRPVFGPEARHDWSLMRRICPGAYIEQSSDEGVREDHLWGPIVSAHVGFAADDHVRWRASSGGVLTAVLTWLVESGTVDAVIQAGASETDPASTSMYINSTVEEVVASAGSRYAPTAPLAVLPRVLGQHGSKYAFVGKPCDVAALRGVLESQPELRDRIAVIISFFCAGVPSQNATREIVEKMGIEPAEIRDFRYRGHGWPGALTVTNSQGHQKSMSYSRSWGEILNKRLQFRCKICPDGIGELADIVCGDAWETEDGYPDFTERPGLSLVLSRTQIGESILRQSEEADYVELSPYDISHLADVQPYQRDRRRAILPRLAAMRIAGHAVPQYQGFSLLQNALRAGPIFFMRQFFGMLSRLWRKKLLHEHT